MSDSRSELLVCRLGLVAYTDAWELQRELAAARAEGRIADVLLLLEHHPVYSKGRRVEAAELPMGEEWYERQGIEVRQTDRGGRVTYHGPGQLVAYPIVGLEDLSRRVAPEGATVKADVVDYVRRMEKVIIGALSDCGVPARTLDGLTGVWTQGERPDRPAEPGAEVARKIGSIGVHVSRGVTTHGLAVNCSNDLQPFEWIVPCGIDDCRMTSLTRELGRAAEPDELAAPLVERWEGLFESRAVEIERSELLGRVQTGAGAAVA
ncbi:lipoyl(octanoyl) transferase LipB [Thermoleophilia bacterium SCSIO 60948]|nr:lipoyl(octanoyl) transferase LipB [Thermoleophilia bacterium SCSIO 60948]